MLWLCVVGAVSLLSYCCVFHLTFAFFVLLSVVLLSFAKTGYTALMDASEKGHKDIVRMLLKSKANVNAVNEDGDFGDISEPIYYFFSDFSAASLISVC